MFSTAAGTPYSFLTAVPYEKASSVYVGKFFFVAVLRKIGVTRPFAASLPVQSCAAVMTSGASAAATVPRLSRMSPKFLVTTLIVAPFVAAQSPATFVTAAARSESVQITMLTALCAAVACAARTAATAANMPSSAHMRLSEFCIKALLCLGTQRGPAGGRHQGTSVDRDSSFTRGFPANSFCAGMQLARDLRYARNDGGHPDNRAQDAGPGAAHARG